MTTKLYHGSTETINKPVVSLGRRNLDFGLGFYLTDIQSQAESWARRLAFVRGMTPVVNVYDIDMNDVKKEYHSLAFNAYDEEWLDFIVANRMGHNLASEYDIIEGGVANDRVIDSIEAYIAGMMPKELCLQRLAEHRPNNQICILNQDLCDKYLHFQNSYNL